MVVCDRGGYVVTPGVMRAVCYDLLFLGTFLADKTRQIVILSRVIRAS